MGHPNNVGFIEVSPGKVRISLSEDFWDEVIAEDGTSLFDYRVEYLCQTVKTAIYTASLHFLTKH